MLASSTMMLEAFFMALKAGPLAAIRYPDKIRACVARAVPEADALRRLLRIAESAGLSGEEAKVAGGKITDDA